MLYMIVTYDPEAGRARRFAVLAEGDDEAFAKVARLVPSVADYGAVTRRLSDFLSDVGELPEPAEYVEFDWLVEPEPPTG